MSCWGPGCRLHMMRQCSKALPPNSSGCQLCHMLWSATWLLKGSDTFPCFPQKCEMSCCKVEGILDRWLKHNISWLVHLQPSHTMVCGSKGQPCSGPVTPPATVMQVVLGGLKRGLTMTEAEKAMRRATAESAQGQVRISEAEKDFTSQASCFPFPLSQIDPNDPQVNSIQGNNSA